MINLPRLDDILKITRFFDWYHYLIICSIFFYKSYNFLSVFYIFSLSALLSGIYMLNDFYDIKIDIKKTTISKRVKIIRKKQRKKLGMFVVFILLLSLILSYKINFNVFIFFSIIIIINYPYSSHYFFFKSIPIVDLITIFFIYTFVILTSFEFTSFEFILISSFFGLLASSAHILQSIIDMKIDKKEGLSTIAVFLGRKKSIKLFQISILFLISYFSIISFYFINKLLLPTIFIYFILFFVYKKGPKKTWKIMKLISIPFFIALFLFI